MMYVVLECGELSNSFNDGKHGNPQVFMVPCTHVALNTTVKILLSEGNFIFRVI